MKVTFGGHLTERSSEGPESGVLVPRVTPYPFPSPQPQPQPSSPQVVRLKKQILRQFLNEQQDREGPSPEPLPSELTMLDSRMEPPLALTERGPPQSLSSLAGA